MEAPFPTVFLVCSFMVYSSPTASPAWDDVVVVREGEQTTLTCADTTVRGPVAINWKVKPRGVGNWELVLFASENKDFSGGAFKPSMRLTDPNFQDTGNFSLVFNPTMDDQGLYLCLIQQRERKVKERIILLAIFTVTVVPEPPVLQHSTLRLLAKVTPDLGQITWVSPDGSSMRVERKAQAGAVTKVPQVSTVDGGTYVCTVHSDGVLFPFDVDVTVDANNVASFTNITHAHPISAATPDQEPFALTCPSVQGDYVVVHWKLPDSKKGKEPTPVFRYNRWSGSTLTTQHSKRLQLAGPPFNADAGSFSFFLTPTLKDGGTYMCEVYLNDNVFSQWTFLSVLKVKTVQAASQLDLLCLYSERSQVHSVKWAHQNKSRHLRTQSNGVGSITTGVPTPITADTAGTYTCTLQLKNGQTVTQAVTLPYEGSVSVTKPPLLPSLSALLLLVPLVAVAVCLLLWRQKHISDRSIEQSLSVHSGEAENIYENPEDMRQAPPEGSVYMDLKPRVEDDLYKELERYEQCQS